MYEFTVHMEIDGNDEEDAKRLYESIVFNLENTPCVWVIDQQEDN